MTPSPRTQRDIDLDALADAIATRLHASCPAGWSAEDVATLREFAAALRQAKSTALRSMTGILVVGVLSMVVAGFVQWLRQALGR